ncbi:MAG: hypothetical protein BWK80_51170 [Desulfobacteraceae bacterium IS3]|nr:MAG: hypothetical protein BWK80_51170 [Desulfobacteraceae bacterium IS3]
MNSITLYNWQWATPLTAPRTLTINAGMTVTKAAGGTFNLDGTAANPVSFAGTGTITPALTVYYCGSSTVTNIDCQPGGPPEINLKQGATNIASAGSHDFGNVAVGSSSGAITFTVENTGSSNLTLSGSPDKVGITGSTDFSVNQTLTSTPVAGAASTTFTVTFTPSSTAAKTATLSIANNDSDENPYTLNLSGTGTTAPIPPVTAGVTLTGISNITGSTVLATGNATGAGIGERGFYWWIPPSTETHFGGSESGLIPEGYGAGSFSLTLTGLKPGNKYHVKAYVKVGGQIITSDEQLFTTATTGATGNMAPTVLTDTVNYTVSGNSITVSGEITDIGSTPVNVYGFIYAPHTSPYTGDDMPKNGDTAYAMWDRTPLYQGMKFTGTIKNIPPGKWYLRAYAHNVNPDSDAAQTASLGYGGDISFTIACTPETCIPGDVNGDGKVDLADAMLVLRILAGIPVGNINPNADVNGDGKIGLEELGFILQKVAGVR